MKLSIIIPYYNGGKYTIELLDRLGGQITDDVEVILVDDGSKKQFTSYRYWLKVIRKKNGGCASARNRGLKEARGEYIAFIDADDMVPEYYVEKLLDKIRGGYDVIDFSWRSLNSSGRQFNNVLSSDDDRLTNPSVCTRAFKRSYIGDERFNEKKDSTEDEDFSRRLGYLNGNVKHGSISEYMYYYRTDSETSKVMRFKQGLMRTKRVVYYYRHVTADMTDLLDEIKREDERNEVWLLTEQNDIPELARYCQISRPFQIWGHYAKGEDNGYITLIEVPDRADVVMYVEHANEVGGITTFIYNWCYHMREWYDILVLYDSFGEEQAARLSGLVRAKKNDGKPIICETIILNRLTDRIPQNVKYGRTVQLCHACVQLNYRIPQDRDILINVSQAAKDSWGEESADGVVIHNMTGPEHGRALLLISATRCGAFDKGSNDDRMRKLAEKLEAAGIRFLWLNFSDKGLHNMPSGFVNMAATPDVRSYIARADYLVQLSDKEAYSMSILEALTSNTAVIATPFPSLYEEGFIDGVHGYAVPYNMDFDVKKLLDVPRFDFAYDNKKIIAEWKKILGRKPKRRTEKPKNGKSLIECTRKYYDIELGRMIHPGEIIEAAEDRAAKICDMGYGRRV